MLELIPRVGFSQGIAQIIGCEVRLIGGKGGNRCEGKGACPQSLKNFDSVETKKGFNQQVKTSPNYL